MQRVKFDEYFDLGCADCSAAFHKVIRPYWHAQKDGKLVPRTTLDIPEDMRLVISPDYNSAGHLTHFHMELVKKSDIAPA